MLLSSSYCLLSKWVASIVLCFVVSPLAPNMPFLQSWSETFFCLYGDGPSDPTQWISLTFLQRNNKTFAFTNEIFSLQMDSNSSIMSGFNAFDWYLRFRNLMIRFSVLRRPETAPGIGENGEGLQLWIKETIKLTFTKRHCQRTVARRMVSANHWLKKNRSPVVSMVVNAA